MFRILSYVFLILGIAGMVTGELDSDEVLICIALCMVLRYISSRNSDDKRFRDMVNSIREKGMEDQIRSNVQLAIEVYKGCPNKKMLEYIRTLNPAAAQAITEQNSARKK